MNQQSFLKFRVATDTSWQKLRLSYHDTSLPRAPF
jgi:hypothetical protein